MHEIIDPEPNKYGDDAHPAFGLLGVSRVQSSPPGVVLFDSDIRHQNSVIVRLHTASRKREISRDWIHSTGQQFEVQMSEAQWASFVSSMNNGDGVPCTVRATPTNYDVPGLPYDPRLAHSMKETHEAADRAFGKIKDAMSAYEEKRSAENLRNLHYAIKNATPNVDYAGKTLSEHAENVVQRARADIEAFVTNKATQLGLTADDIGHHTLELGPHDGLSLREDGYLNPEGTS